MKKEQEIQGFWTRVILATFAACWLFGIASSLLAFGMGFENGYLTSDKVGVAERVGHGSDLKVNDDDGRLLARSLQFDAKQRFLQFAEPRKSPAKNNVFNL